MFRCISMIDLFLDCGKNSIVSVVIMLAKLFCHLKKLVLYLVNVVLKGKESRLFSLVDPCLHF